MVCNIHKAFDGNKTNKANTKVCDMYKLFVYTTNNLSLNYLYPHSLKYGKA